MSNKSIIIAFIVALSTITAYAKPKITQVPGIKDYQQLGLSKKNVASMNVTVYAADNETLKDFPVTYYFDNTGNVIKEEIKSPLTGKIEYVIITEYDLKKLTATQYCLDTLNEQVWKKTYTVEDNSVRIKIEERWYDSRNQAMIYDLLTTEQIWQPEGKEILFRKYKYDRFRTVSQRIDKKFPITKDSHINNLIEEFGNDQVIYVWYPSYISDYLKARNKKTRTEEYTGGRTTYAFKNKNIAGKNIFRSRDNKNAVYSYDYELDKQGNWTKLNLSIDDNLTNVVVREIIYR